MSLSEIRVNTTKTRTGVGTITYTETGPVITGIATASNFKTGSTNVHSTGVELTNINTGGATATFGGALSGTTASFSGNVSIGGTLTYEDVTNIDSVGILTARAGIKVTGGNINIENAAPRIDLTDTGANPDFAITNTDGNFDVTDLTNTATRLRITSGGAVGINETSPTGKLTITQDPQGFVDDSAQPQATFLIKHGTSGTNRRWVGIGASLTGAWLQSSSPGGTGLAAPFWINKGGGDVTLGNDKLKVAHSGAIQCKGETDVQNSIFRVTDGTPRIIMSVPSGGLDTRLFNDGSGNFIIGHGTNSDTPTERLRIGSTGNLAVGGTNTSAYSGHTNFFIGGMANLYAETTAASGASLSLSNNAYINSSGNWVYRTGGKSTNLYQYDGSIGFRTAGTGSAGGTISWKERFTIGDNQNIYIWGNETGNNRAIFYNGPGYFGTYASSSNSVARQLRWHTAGGSASEKMRLSSDGFLLLNCQDTGYSSSYTDMTIGNTSASNTGLTIASSPTNGYSRLHFADGTSGGAKYAGFIAYAHGTDELLFGTGNSGSSKLIMNSDGAIQFGSAGGGNYSSGGAINLIDFGSGTLNRGMGWGGTNSNYANIWTEYGSGALHFGMGIRPTGTSSGWVSSYGGGSIGRSALKMDLNGDIRIFTASGSTIAAGSATNLTEKLLIHRTGQITHQFAGRYGQVIGSTDGSGAYILLDGEAGNPLASGSDYMYMEHTSTGQFEMWNGKSGVTSSKFLDVAPAGYINAPKQPSFAVYRNQSGWTVATGTEMVFNSARHNNGGHYNTSNGRFTAPISGSYFFSFFSIHNSNVNSGYVRLFKNGARIYGGDLHFTYNQSGHWDNVAFSQVLYLSTNDFVSIYNGNPAVNYHGNHWQCFSGYLLG